MMSQQNQMVEESKSTADREETISVNSITASEVSEVD